MGDRAEAVKRTAHVKLPACRHIQQSQVDRTAAAVGGLFCDITALEQLLLLQLGVEIRLHADILILDPPQHEMLDRADGTISVKHLDAVALHHQLVADRFERAGGFFGQEGARLLIAVDALADKIVGRVIADLLDDAGHMIREQNKARGIVDDICVNIFHGNSLSEQSDVMANLLSV